MKAEHPDFVVLTIINEELEAVEKVFTERSGKEFREHTDTSHPVSASFLELEISGQKVFLVKPADKGNPPAATLTKDIIDYWNPRYLLLVGIGGGVKDVGKLCGGRRRESGLKIGDVVFSKSIHYYEYQNIEGGKSLLKVIPLAQPSRDLRNIAQHKSMKWEYNGSRAKEGIILTGEKVINDPNYARDIVCPHFQGERVLVFETEAGGVARAVYDVINKKKPSFLLIRGISDFVDDLEGRETRKSNRKLAAEAAAAFAYELVRVIAEAERDKRRKNLNPYLDEAKRLFTEKSPVDGKAPKDYYVPPNVLIVDRETWNKKEKEVSGREWDVQEFLENDNQWYVVIGASFGMGKTTYVKHLAYILANDFERYGYVPIFIHLRRWTEKEVENDTVSVLQGKTVRKALEEIVSAGARPLLILDGLDEFSGDYSIIYNWITKLHEKYENLKVIVTTRLNAGIPRKLHIRSYVRPLNFDESQIKRFFEKYGAKMNLGLLMEHINEEDLGKPLFCWMIAVSSVRAENPEVLFIEDEDPNKRKAFFYYTVTHYLLRGKHLGEIGKGLDLYEKEKEFLRLAAAYMNFMKYIETPETYDRLLKWVENFVMRLEKESSLKPFITSYFHLHETIKGKIVEFIHQSFQDYFLAEYYYENIVNGRYWRLNIGVPSRETLDFLEGLASLSLDEKAMKKLKRIDQDISGFLGERVRERAMNIVELNDVVLPPKLTERGFSESMTKREIWAVSSYQRPLSELLLHRWIALEALGRRGRKNVKRETLEYLIKNSRDLVGLFSLSEVNLSEADLRGADLTGADLTAAYLGGSILVRANLTGANLRGADLTGADLTGADLTAAYLGDADLREANLIGAILIGADLRGADLTGADLTAAYLGGSILVRANLTGANLRGADLRGAILIGADLRGADLRGSILVRANLSEANLNRVILGDTKDEIISNLKDMDSMARSIILNQNPHLREIWESYLKESKQER